MLADFFQRLNLNCDPDSSKLNILADRLFITEHCKLMRLGSGNRIVIVESNLDVKLDRRLTLIRISKN